MGELFYEKQLDDVFSIISSSINEPVEAFLIGGLAMIKNGMKTSTKDIDMVFPTEKDARVFIRAAKKAGFLPDEKLPSEYEEMGTMVVLKDKSERRLDIFVDVVLSCLTYTSEMKGRARRLNYDNQLTIHVSSNEDIFLFKAITPRPRDLEDMEVLARTGTIDWDIIEREARNQPTPWKWIGRLFGRLRELETKAGIVTPLTRRLEKEAEMGQAIEILLGRFAGGPIEKEGAMRILKEEDEGFILDVLSAMEQYGLVREKDGRYQAL
jgi:hypothetical protein